MVTIALCRQEPHLSSALSIPFPRSLWTKLATLRLFHSFRVHRNRDRDDSSKMVSVQYDGALYLSIRVYVFMVQTKCINMDGISLTLSFSLPHSVTHSQYFAQSQFVAHFAHTNLQLYRKYQRKSKWHSDKVVHNLISEQHKIVVMLHFNFN